MNLYTSTYGAENSSAMPKVHMECKMHWTVYDPMSDDAWQMIPRKTFAQLRDYWRYAQCGNKKHDFLIFDD